MPGFSLYYIRHGETDWNRQGRLQGQQDVPLNPTGRRQAAACGPILADLAGRDGRHVADYAYLSSPLVRARETMELMRDALGLDRLAYGVDPRLREMSFGSWEGFTLKEIGASQPDLLAVRERDKWHFVPPHGESYEQVAARMRAWYLGLERDAVVVSHGGTLRTLMVALGIAPPETAPATDIVQGAVYHLAGHGMTCYR
jgi:probable phosphoglycerate mutase